MESGYGGSTRDSILAGEETLIVNQCQPWVEFEYEKRWEALVGTQSKGTAID